MPIEAVDPRLSTPATYTAFAVAIGAIGLLFAPGLIDDSTPLLIDPPFNLALPAGFIGGLLGSLAYQQLALGAAPRAWGRAMADTVHPAALALLRSRFVRGSAGRVGQLPPRRRGAQDDDPGDAERRR